MNATPMIRSALHAAAMALDPLVVDRCEAKRFVQALPIRADGMVDVEPFAGWLAARYQLAPAHALAIVQDAAADVLAAETFTPER